MIFFIMAFYKKKCVILFFKNIWVALANLCKDQLIRQSSEKYKNLVLGDEFKQMLRILAID
jgi:hypothetical protein